MDKVFGASTEETNMYHSGRISAHAMTFGHALFWMSEVPLHQGTLGYRINGEGENNRGVGNGSI